MVHVAVGSGNPVKAAATEAVVDAVFAGDSGEASAESSDVSVAAVAVDSGVSEQPVGHGETVAGAENRAERALDAEAGADYGVGIEGGVADLDVRPGLYLVMWAAVTDGDRLERAAGPAVRLPASIADRLRDGAELGPVLDDVLGTDGIKEDVGAAGVLTGEAIDRQSALEHAVAGAVGPFVTDHYD